MTPSAIASLNWFQDGLASDAVPLCAADYQPKGAKPLAPSAIAIKGEIPTPSGMKPYPEPQVCPRSGEKDFELWIQRL